jgi:hypothetical protein
VCDWTADAIEQEKVGGYWVRELKSDDGGLGDWAGDVCYW